MRRAERARRRTGVEDVVAEPDADGPLRGARKGEHAVGEVVRAEGIALGKVEGGIGFCLTFVRSLVLAMSCSPDSERVSRGCAEPRHTLRPTSGT